MVTTNRNGVLRISSVTRPHGCVSTVMEHAVRHVLSTNLATLLVGYTSTR